MPRTAVPRLKLPILSVLLISSTASAAAETVFRCDENAEFSAGVGAMRWIRVANLSEMEMGINRLPRLYTRTGANFTLHSEPDHPSACVSRGNARQIRAEIWGQLGAKTRAFGPQSGVLGRQATDSTGLLVGAVGIEPATLAQPVQCLRDSSSRKLVRGSVQTDKDFQKIRQPQRERRRGWASWAIHGLFKKLTDCGDAS